MKKRIQLILLATAASYGSAFAELPKVTVSEEAPVAAPQQPVQSAQEVQPVRPAKNDSERFWGKKHPRTVIPTQEIEEAYDPSQKPGVDLRPVSSNPVVPVAQQPAVPVPHRAATPVPVVRSSAAGSLAFVHKKAGVSVYASPAANGKRIRFAPDNTPVIRLETKNGWSMVELPSHVTGWVRDAELSAAAPDNAPASASMATKPMKSSDEIHPLVRQGAPQAEPLPAESQSARHMPSTDDLALSASSAATPAPEMEMKTVHPAGEAHVSNIMNAPARSPVAPKGPAWIKLSAIGASVVLVVILLFGWFSRRINQSDSWFES